MANERDLTRLHPHRSITVRMTSNRHAHRVAILAGHLTEVAATPDSVETQDCAATHLSSFARPALSGARFARPAQQSFSRDERVQETAMLYGIGPLQEAAAKWKSKREFTSDKPVPKSLGPVNAFQSIKGWTPQVHVLTRNRGTVYIFLLPGVKAGDIKLQVSGNVLSLSGRRVQGIHYTAGQQSEGRNVPMLREDKPIHIHGRPSADGKGVASTPGKRPLLQEGQFQAEWLLPRGDYKTMHATFNNERLRVLLPKA